MRKVQHGITQQDQQLFVFSPEDTGQWLVMCLDHNAFPHPLPKLSLSGPELLTVATYDERALLLLSLFLVFFCVHLPCPPADHTSALACTFGFGPGSGHT